MSALSEAIPPLLAWAFFALGPAGATAAKLTQPNVMQEARLCLRRVAPLPKSEGYGALCTSIEALYQQQRNAASSFLALQQQSERQRTQHTALGRRNEELEAKIEELQQHKISREKELEAKIEELQQHKISQEAKIEELQQHEISREKKWQAAASKFQAEVASRDAQRQASIRRLEAEKLALTRQEGAERKRAILLTRNRAEQKSHREVQGLVEKIKALQIENENAQLAQGRAESKEVQGLMEQIKALQIENAQLVQRCG